MSTELASHTLTFLFTDVEGSTRLWEEHPQHMREALARHDSILRKAVESSNGSVVKTTGDGLMAVFASALDGIAAASRAQLGLTDERWGETGPLRSRMALHAGEAALRDGDYFGPTLNRAARIMAAGHGGQVLLSAAVAALVADQLPPGATIRDLGEHRLKDLTRPERVFELLLPGLAVIAQPLVTLDGRRSQLPAQPLAFVGREAESSEIRERLWDPSVRLLTLIGPGGIGKTRLAIHAAADAADQFQDGVCFVDLAAVRDAESALVAIGRAAGLEDARDGSRLDELVAGLQDQRLLLLLDNFEQVTSAAPSAARLANDCPSLKLLITSREALHVRGERLFPVPPLSLPDASQRSATPEQLSRFEAIQLFVERARGVRPDFRLTDDNAAAVAEICVRLDGLPLAIELATARINLFSPEALSRRLGSRLDLLRSSARDLPERQQTLRATIDWSYQLLHPAEQRFFDLLSIFESADLEAIEAVTSSTLDGALAGPDALDAVTSLYDKSLLRQTEQANGEPRVLLLETVRAYGAERLAADAAFHAEARRAHATYYSELAARSSALGGARREEVLGGLGADQGNLQVAWRFWVEHDDLERLDPLADCLWWLFDARGRYQASIDLDSDLLGMLASRPPSADRRQREVSLRIAQARSLMAMDGFTVEVEQAYQAALALFDGEEVVGQLYPVLRGLASYYQFKADLDNWERMGDQLMRLAEAGDEPSMRVDGHLTKGAAVAFRGDIQGGLEHLRTAIAIIETPGFAGRRFRQGNDPRVACYTTAAFFEWLLGHPDSGLRHSEQAHATALRLAHPYSLAYARFHLGLLHLWRREPGLARDRAVDVLDVAEAHGFPIWQATGRALLGAAMAQLGRCDEGLAEINAGIAQYQVLQTPPVFWPLLMLAKAGGLLVAGRAGEGLEVINTAIDMLTAGGGTTLLPEFYVCKGQLLAALPDAEAARGAFQHALELARELDERLPQLRAAMGIRRLATAGTEMAEASDQLRSILSSFTEGFETADLREAAQLSA